MSTLPREHRSVLAPTPLERLRIGRVEVRTENVYDPRPGVPLASLRRLANRLHVRTRPGTVRNELLFQPGDRWSARTAEETARNLRNLDFLVPAAITARRESDSVVVNVTTRDLWTTSPELDLQTVGGTRTGAWGFSERNLFGFGKSIILLYQQDPTTVTRSIEYDDPNIHGSRVRLSAGLGRSAEGSSRHIALWRPFYAEETPRSWTLSAADQTSIAHLYQSGIEAANFDVHGETFALAYGVRLPGDSVITRLTASLEGVDRRYGPSRVLAPDAPIEFTGGEESDRRRTVAVELQLWDPNYVELLDVDRMDRPEDFDLGTLFRMKGGIAPRAFGSTVNEGYGRIELARGVRSEFGFGWIRAAVEGRFRPDPMDLLSFGDARWYVLAGRHTLVLDGSLNAGAYTTRAFQILAGGLNGLRAFPTQALAGRQALRFNTEERWLFTPADWELVHAATAVFYDGARARGPGAAGSTWFHDVGVGLRLGFPQVGLAQVVRLDLAWPLQPTVNGSRAAVLSIGSSQAF